MCFSSVFFLFVAKVLSLGIDVFSVSWWPKALSLTLPTSLILYQFPAFALSVSFHLSFSQTNFRFILSFSLSLPLYLHPSFHHSPGRGSVMWSPHGWRCKLRGERRWRSTTSGCKGWSHLEEEMQMVTQS